MSVGPTPKMKKRLNRIVIVAVVLCFVFISANLVKISVVDYDFYNDWANSHQLRSETVAANRGSIYDRNGEILAQSAPAWDVILNPSEIKDDQRERIVEGLSAIFGYDESEQEDLLEKTQRNTMYVLVERQVEKSVQEQILQFITADNEAITAENAASPDGVQKTPLVNQIELRENTKRYYPNSTMAASVIGFVGTDSQGLYGLEAQYDSVLSGTPGYVLSLKNAINENIPNSLEEKVNPVNGSSLVLTIDENIQHFVEKALGQAMKDYLPKEGACAIVMNVKTGEILAMSNMPSFDLNAPFTIYDEAARTELEALKGSDEYKEALGKAQQEQWFNKSISYAYQPGSTFKTIVASAALEEKTSSLNDHYNCAGFVRVADRTMRCHKTAGHGVLDFGGALVNSCNPAYIAIGEKLGPSLYYRYLQGFGFTARTGIDLPAEGESVYYTEEGLRSVVTLASCSFGQSIAVTPIQVITAVSAVTNGGYLMQPYIVKDILDENGNIISSTQPEVKRQVISEETSAIMRQLMEKVVYDKTATNAYVKGYRIGGKSGTSQKQNPGDDENARIGSYVSVAPIDDPEIAVLVMIDEPQSGDVYGSVVAAPVTASIMADTLPYLGYSPQYSSEEAEKMEVTVPTLLEKGILEAESALAAVGLSKPQIVGNGNYVVRQVPSSGNMIPRDGRVILYTEDVSETMTTVPNVLGMTPSIAKQRLKDAKLNVIINGPTEEAGEKLEITTQSLEANTQVPIGTVMEITSTRLGTD